MTAGALIWLLLAFEWPGALDADARDLASTDDAQRLRAVERLAVRDPVRAKPLLLPALRDRDPGIRLVAARVMARAGVAEAIDVATSWIMSPSTRDRPAGLQVLRDAATLPQPARRAAERALGDGDPAIRVQALEVLARHELGSSFGVVVAAIDDDNRDVRVSAVRLLGDAQDPRAAVPLLARLSDSDRQVRLQTLRALGALGDPQVAPAVSRLLSDASDDVRMAAIDALGRLRVASAVPALETLARRRPTDDLARHAQLALGAIGSPQAALALVRLAREPPIGDELKEALRRAGGVAVDPLVRELAAGTPTSAAVAAAALGEIGDHRATAALAAAVDRGGGVTPAALAALAALADPDAIPALVRAAGAPAADTRRLAFDALEATGDDRAVVLLPRALADADAGVRARAIRLVVALGARPLAPDLAFHLDDPDPDVRHEAAQGLARLSADAPTVSVPLAPILAALAGAGAANRDDRTIDELGDVLERAVRPDDGPKLAQTLRTAKGPARVALARGLAAAQADRSLDDPPTIDHLIALLDEGGAVALAAADALAGARLPPGREAPLARAFGDAEAPVQARLCPALAGSEAGAARLMSLLASRDLPEEVRAAAAWAATGPESQEALRRAALDPAPAVAANARAALTAGPKRARGAWVGVRLVAPDGTPWPGRWVVVSARDGVEVWSMTDSTGRARVGTLTPGPYELRRVDPALRIAPAVH